jgi:hypothetical protein
VQVHRVIGSFGRWHYALHSVAVRAGASLSLSHRRNRAAGGDNQRYTLVVTLWWRQKSTFGDIARSPAVRRSFPTQQSEDFCSGREDHPVRKTVEDLTGWIAWHGKSDWPLFSARLVAWLARTLITPAKAPDARPFAAGSRTHCCARVRASI